MPDSDEGRIVLVTGASRGIGRAAASALVRQGARVVGTARSAGALQDIAGELGARFTPFAVDMVDGPGLERLAAFIAGRFGRLDGLFGNAGILGTRATIDRLDDADVERTLSINVTSSYRLLHTLHPLLLRSEAGRVLFATSGVAWKRHAGWTLYAVSKAALEAMIGVYANEIAASPIRANLLSPGPIRTTMRIEAWPDEDPSTVPPPEDLAPFIIRLLSPETTENGAIYDFKLRRFIRNSPPA
jgi:NAD(P)-dependent dehydrogenase (short-subunit alcohol dehydrogenase family)